VLVRHLLLTSIEWESGLVLGTDAADLFPDEFVTYSIGILEESWAL
jgi:hypothetical protein